MPIYAYKCKKGHRFDVMQSFTEDPVASCEVCGTPVEKVLHSPAIHFKGKGFYSTDYGSKKRARELKDAAEGSSKGENSSSESNSNSNSDSKSESKSDSKSDSSKGESKKSESTKSDSKPAKNAA
jgi:putative FmdB family regulatory protein